DLVDAGEPSGMDAHEEFSQPGHGGSVGIGARPFGREGQLSEQIANLGRGVGRIDPHGSNPSNISNVVGRACSTRSTNLRNPSLSQGGSTNPASRGGRDHSK